MKNIKLIKYADYLFSLVFFTGIFVFFEFFYRNHLHFEEQFQLFLLKSSYFIEKMRYPGGFTGYLGEFLTQFYFLPVAGPLIIAGLLTLLRQVIKRILFTINPNPLLFPFSFIPSLFAGMILCNEFYPLSFLTGFLLGVTPALIYIRINDDRYRFITGLIMIPVVYWLAGGSYISLLLMMLVHERIHRPRVLHFFVYLLAGALIPLIAWRFLILQPVLTSFIGSSYYNILSGVPYAVLVLFILPVILMLSVRFISIGEKYIRTTLIVQVTLILILSVAGFANFANFDAEKTMKYDYLVRNKRWDEVITYAEKKPPGNYLSLAMLNLSLAKAGQLGDKMFHYGQHGMNGLFLSFKNKEYVTPMMGNEIFYHLGLINASQQYAFESMETIPNMGKSARIIKRLAETNLINGHYKVSEKYLKLLEATLFYRKWAHATMDYLNDDEKINSDSDWGEKRKFMIRSDYFFHIQNIEFALTRMIKEHPDNKMAFEYLMAYYLINKDLKNFISYIPLMEKMPYKEIPASYQEAILFILASNNEDPVTSAPRYVSQSARQRIKAYAEIYNAYPDARERLSDRFSDSYWYYLHFTDSGSDPGEIEN